MVDEKIYENFVLKIISIVKREFPTKKNLNKKSKIVHDLGIMGDDADELFECISREFKVEFQPGEFSEFFPNEGELLGARWIKKWLFLKPDDYSDYKEFTIGDLASKLMRSKKM